MSTEDANRGPTAIAFEGTHRYNRSGPNMVVANEYLRKRQVSVYADDGLTSLEGLR